MYDVSSCVKELVCMLTCVYMVVDTVGLGDKTNLRAFSLQMFVKQASDNSLLTPFLLILSYHESSMSTKISLQPSLVICTDITSTSQLDRDAWIKICPHLELMDG